jgi:uncharacterized membrane protein YkvA (DUF1232 family)
MATVRRLTAMKALWDAVRGAQRPGVPSVWARVRAVPRMIAQGLTGRYPFLAKGRIGLAVVALLYVLSPIDLVPELLLPILGLGDDAIVVAWLAGTLLAETEAFLTWEKDQSRVIVGEVVG